jgi:site-specific DNA-methyltransferase (adenine-specific)
MKESNDILTLFEALSNYEIFTPPRLARDMLNLLPNEVWGDPNFKFLDPATKSGVFLREIFYRLFDGLKDKGVHLAHDGKIYDLNDQKQRITHILKNMIYGISISELTGYVARRTLYGVMEANTDKQLAALDSFERSTNYQDWTEEEKWNFIGRNKFNEYFDHNVFNTDEYKGFESEGNIFFPRDEVTKLVLEDGHYEVEDTYFPFIDDRTKHKKILDIKEGKMKFDVIIGNPPYQKSDGGKTGAMPLYHEFVKAATNLSPKHLCMIIPTRWYAGGRGLNKFREYMMSDKRLKVIVDYPKSRDCFPGVDIAGGVCYFLWSTKHSGECLFTSEEGGKKTTLSRYLDEFNIVVRNNEAIKIIHKIKELGEMSMSEKVLTVSPFGIRSYERGEDKPFKNCLTVISSGGKGYIAKAGVTKNESEIDKYKLMIGYLNPDRAGVNNSADGKVNVTTKTRILEKGEVVTETYIIPFTSNNMSEVVNSETYLKTKFCRFLIYITLSSMHITKSSFDFVPLQDFRKPWSDAELYKKYNLSEYEIHLIESKIKNME